jgi:hypothetical protein
MRPRRRYLKGNAGTEGPTSLLFFDSESYEPEPVPGRPRREMTLRLWVAAYVRREGDTFREPIYHRGRTAKAFWDLVDRLSDWRRPLWAFAHNLGHDLTQLRFWDELETWRYTAGPVERPADPDTNRPRPPWRGRLCLEGRPTFLVVRGRRGTLKLVDTGNYWPTALARVGERAQLPKIQMPAWDAPDSEWDTYCQRDVDICRFAVCDLMGRWLKEDRGVFQMTAPSLAFHHFQHTCPVRAKDGQAVGIVLEDDSPARACERGAYMGGRIEPFFVGTHPGPIFHLDCNSLYPSVMRDELFPRARVRRLLETTPDRLAGFMEAYGAAADVRIATGPSSETYPVKCDGVQVHACGSFWTTLCGPELRRALAAGHVDRVGECHLYSMAPLFRDWCDRWLDRLARAKAAGDQGEAEFVKLVVTSLPGKFGQKGDWWVDAPERGPRKGWGLTWRLDPVRGISQQYRYVAGHVQKKLSGNEPPNAFPIIAAYVTSYARERMRDAFAILPPDSLLYTGTDSIITTQPGFSALDGAGLVHATEFGKYRQDGVYDEIEICGPNWYREDNRWIISGLHGRSYVAPDGRVLCDVWDHLPDLMQRNPDGRCGITTLELKGRKPTHKNEPGPNGFRVPKRFSGDDDFTDRPPRLRDRLVVREH